MDSDKKSEIAYYGGEDRSLPWFKFYAKRWLDSPTVQKMTDGERGIFIQILAALWVHGDLPASPPELSRQLHTRPQAVLHWLKKYAHLILELGCSRHPAGLESNCPACVALKDSAGGRFTVPRLADPEGSTKASGAEAGDIRRGYGEPERRGPPTHYRDPQHPHRWAGDPNPDCTKCEGRGTLVVNGRTVWCECCDEIPEPPTV